jgi:hypothetical protein
MEALRGSGVTAHMERAEDIRRSITGEDRV